MVSFLIQFAEKAETTTPQTEDSSQEAEANLQKETSGAMEIAASQGSVIGVIRSLFFSYPNYECKVGRECFILELLPVKKLTVYTPREFNIAEKSE